MTEAAALLRLMTMLSPAFPVGSYAFSGGLEQAVADGLVDDPDSLREWLSDLLEGGALHNDAVLFAEAWRVARYGGNLNEINDLALALAGSSGRHTETTGQGGAFASAASVWTLPDLPRETAYCVAVGAVAAANGIGLEAALGAFLNAAVTNQVQAAIRLSVTGQQGGVRVVAALESRIAAIAATPSTLDDLGGPAMMAEIAAMNHETLPSRIFRT